MNIKHYKFVTEYLKWGDQVIAYKNAYNSASSYKSLQSAANRLLNDPEVAKAIYESESRIRGEVEIAIVNRQIKEILTIEEKRTLLKQIAAGTMYVEQKYKGKNCTQCSQYISPTINQMLAAIREDNKLAGHYPHKQNGKWVIPALQTEQEQEEDISPLGSCVPPTLLVGGGPESIRGREKQETQDENPQQITTNTSSEVHRESPTPTPLQGGEEKTEHAPHTTKDNKSGETIIDNQPLTEDLDTHETPTVNTAGRIISQEQLRELLYPQKPKLSYMKNNP